MFACPRAPCFWSLSGPGRLALALGILAGLVACRQGSDFQAPRFEGKDDWAGGLESGALLPDEWWHSLGSAALDALVQRALAGNPDLAQSLARVQLARAQAGVDDSALFPQLSLKSGVQAERLSGSLFGANLPPGVPLPPLQRDRWQGLLSLNYELDFWGRVQRQREAARARVQSMQERLAAQRLTVVAEVVVQYAQLCSLDGQLEVLRRAVALRADALALQESKRAAGLANEVEAERARTEWQLTRAEAMETQRQRGRLAHALALLCGCAPSELHLPICTKLPKAVMPKRPLPSSLLLRRPDLRAMAAQLHEANARIGMAKADFLPRFTLVASGGFDSVGAQDFLDWRSRAGTLGPQLELPLFQGGRLRAQLQAAGANQAIELAAWRKLVITALGEVEDATLDWQNVQQQITATRAALQAAQQTQSLSQLRHEKGLASYFEVVDAQRVVLSAELSLRRLEGSQLVAAVQLIRALGGGWSPER